MEYTFIYQISKNARKNFNLLNFKDSNWKKFFAWDIKKFNWYKKWSYWFFVNPDLFDRRLGEKSILFVKLIDKNYTLNKSKNWYLIKSDQNEYTIKNNNITFYENENNLNDFLKTEFVIFEVIDHTTNELNNWDNIWVWLINKIYEEDFYLDWRLSYLCNLLGEKNKLIKKFYWPKTTVIENFKLIWIYFNDYKSLKQKFINLSWINIYSYDGNKLNISKSNNTNLLKNWLIENITAIVWKNWTWKSTIIWEIWSFYDNLYNKKSPEWKFILFFSNNDETEFYKIYSDSKWIWEMFDLDGNISEKVYLDFKNNWFIYLNIAPIDPKSIKESNDFYSNIDELSLYPYIYWWVYSKSAYFPERNYRELNGLLWYLLLNDEYFKLFNDIIFENFTSQNFIFEKYKIKLSKNSILRKSFNDLSDLINSFIKYIELYIKNFNNDISDNSEKNDKHIINFFRMKSDFLNGNISDYNLFEYEKNFNESLYKFKKNTSLVRLIFCFLKTNENWNIILNEELYKEYESIFLSNSDSYKENNKEFEIKIKKLKNFINLIQKSNSDQISINNIILDFFVSRLFEIDLVTNKNTWVKDFSSWELHLLWMLTKIFITIIKYNKNNIIITLDEPDSHLHPEWSRNFINIMYKIFNNYSLNENYKTKFNIVLTTHSPLMLSDLSPININFLYKDNIEEIKKAEEYEKSKKSTFLNNLYEILNSPFFIDSYVWEFAKNKMNSFINKEWAEKEIELVGDLILKDWIKYKRWINNSDNLFVNSSENEEN